MVCVWSHSFLPSLLATFHSFIPSLWIFPTMLPNQNFPPLFPTSQRFPEAPRCTRDVTSNTVVSSPLFQLLCFLHWWPLCWWWRWPGRAVGSQQPLVFMGLALRHTVIFPGSFLKRKSCLWLGSHNHGMWGHLDAWEQPADHRQKDLAPHHCPYLSISRVSEYPWPHRCQR